MPWWASAWKGVSYGCQYPDWQWLAARAPAQLAGTATASRRSNTHQERQCPGNHRQSSEPLQRDLWSPLWKAFWIDCNRAAPEQPGASIINTHASIWCHAINGRKQKESDDECDRNTQRTTTAWSWQEDIHFQHHECAKASLNVIEIHRTWSTITEHTEQVQTHTNHTTR